MTKLVGGLVLFALAAALVLRGIVFEWTTVTGLDMAPALAAGETYLIDRLARQPKRGDLIAFELPGAGGASIRRVVGLAGDKVGFKDQHLVINGRPATDEPVGPMQVDLGPLGRELERVRETLPGLTRAYPIAYDPHRRSKDPPVVTVPADTFYVLADNRNHGRDSREYGTVPAARIRGTVIRHIVSLLQYDPIE